MKINVNKSSGKLWGFIEKVERANPQFIAALYMILSSLIEPINLAISKYLNNISGPQLIYFRVVVLLMINTIFLKKNDYDCFNFRGMHTKFMVYTRGIMGCMTSILFYSSLKYIALAESSIIYQAITIWTAIIAVFVLKTQSGSHRLTISILVCFMGLIFVMRPQFLQKFFYDVEEQNDETPQQNRFLGIILALLSSVTSAYVFVISYKLKQEVNSQVLVQYFGIISAIITSIYLVQDGFYPCPSLNEILFLVIFGINSLVSLTLVTKAQMLGKPIQLTLIGYLNVLFSYIMDITIFNVQINLLSTAGIIMIISGLLILIIDKKK